MSHTFKSKSAAETEAAGRRLAARLRAGDVVFVRGEIGAGKTTLIRGACRALGVHAPITSPTFTIGHLYTEGRLPVAHLDLYRVAGLEHEDPALLDDYLAPEGIAFIEWAPVGEPLPARPALELRLDHAGADRRTIEVSCPARRASPRP